MADDVPDFDYSEWPMLVITQPRQTLSVEAHRAMLARITAEAFTRGEPFVLIVDTTLSLDRPDAVHRKLTAEAMQNGSQAHPGLLLGLGLVLHRAADRHVMTALSWLARPPYPLAAFESVDKAKGWARLQLSGAKRAT